MWCGGNMKRRDCVAGEVLRDSPPIASKLHKRRPPRRGIYIE